MPTQRGLLSLNILSVFLFFVTASGDCPRECYCATEALPTTTCVGHGRLSLLPNLSLSLSLEPFTARLELRDFVFANLRLSAKEQEVLFATVDELSLAHNAIERFGVEETELLPGLTPTHTPTLRLLDLSNNNLSLFIATTQMGRVRTLDLSHNALVNLSLAPLIALETLNLRSNAIVHLHEDAFQTLQSLHYVNLDRNRLRTLSPNVFANLPALAHLILSSNPLQLPPGFLFNSRTQFIDVSNAGLSAVPPSLTKTVRDLRLSNNQLRRIGLTDFESFPNLALLVLDQNHIDVFEDDALGRLDFLNALWLNGNRLSRIPQNLPASLQSMQLEENRILCLSQSDFHPLKHLETLNLHGNQLSSLDAEVFAPLVRLRTLILRANAIDSILPTTFANLSALQTLDLSQNPLKVIVNGAFAPLPRLLVLRLARLSDNDLQIDSPTLFRPFLRLQLLDMSRSPYFAKKAIAGLSACKALRELNLDRCDLQHTHLLRICEQVADIDTLQSISGEGNAFTESSHALAPFTPHNLCPPPPPPPPPPLPSGRGPVTLPHPPPTPAPANQVTLNYPSHAPSATNQPQTLIPPTTMGEEGLGRRAAVQSGSWASSYFEESAPSLTPNDDLGLGGVPAEHPLTNEPTHAFPPSLSAPSQTFHPLPQKMALRSSSQHSTPTTHGPLILRTILISAAAGLLSLVLLLALALGLFRLNRRTISPNRTQTSETAASYERLEEKAEVELGISNKVYYQVEQSQVFHIT